MIIVSYYLLISIRYIFIMIYMLHIIVYITMTYIMSIHNYRGKYKKIWK